MCFWIYYCKVNSEGLFEINVKLPNYPYLCGAGGTKYASCFICKERGHLSKDCPKNAHGIYPKVHFSVFYVINKLCS